MAVKIIEFLGMNTHNLSPSDSRLANQCCPYIDKTCKKINRELEQKPMCVVESSSGVDLIVCEHRLLSTVRQRCRRVSDASFLRRETRLRETGSSVGDCEPEGICRVQLSISALDYSKYRKQYLRMV